MKKILCILIVLIGFTNLIQAQSDTLKNDVFGIYVAAPIEFPIIDSREINNELTELDYPKLDHPVANYGIGLQLHLNRLITSFSYNKTTNRDEKVSFLTKTEYRSLSFNFGLDLTKNHSYSIYPFVGLKAYEVSYLYQEKNSDETSFEGYFNSNIEYKEVSYSRTNLDLGVGFSFQSFFLISIKAGYLVPLQSEKWTILNNGNNLSNAPSLSYNYYFAITFGLGNIFSSQDEPVGYESDEQL